MTKCFMWHVNKGFFIFCNFTTLINTVCHVCLLFGSLAIRVDSAHLKADMAVCEQWSFHFNDWGLLVSTDQLDGCSTDALQLICQTLSNPDIRWVKDFGQGVKGTVSKTHTYTHRLQHSLQHK